MPASAGSLDANVILRLLLNDQADHHKAAVALFNSANAPLRVSNTAMIETIFALARHYSFSRAEIAETISRFLMSPTIECQRELFTQALALFTAHPKLSFEDCFLAVEADQTGTTPLWTFDKKLAKQAPTARELT